MTKVVHCKKEAYDIYIGRGGLCMHFGNPFSHLPISKADVRVSGRTEAIRRFKSWLLGESDNDVAQERRTWILNNLDSLRGKILGCWCKPLACHGDVYLELLERRGEI